MDECDNASFVRDIEDRDLALARRFYTDLTTFDIGDFDAGIDPILWTSSPQQFLRKILNIVYLPQKPITGLAGTGLPAKSSQLRKR